MHLLDLTLPTPAENLALDEALLEEAEARALSTSFHDASGENLDDDGECLRLWEPQQPLVVVGRSSHVAEEVRLAACDALGIPVLRRCSGGAAIVTGAGCLMYAVVLSYHRHPALQAIDAAHRYVLGTIAQSLTTLGVPAKLLGTSDLTLDGKKFSGNSLRCKRTHFLYHGTLLYDFPLDLLTTCLGTPPRQPDYRRGRSHRDFVANLPVSAHDLRSSLISQWGAHASMASWPSERTRALVGDRYARDDWNRRY